MDKNERYIFESIVSDMSDGVFVIGFDGKISLCNKAAADALNTDNNALIGKSVAMLMDEFEENDEFFELLLDAVYTRSKVIKTVPFRTDGQMRYLRVTTSFLIKESEKIALMAVISDNTDPVELFIRNKRLANQVIGLMNSFVEVMVTETEERSAYNADHTKNMVRFATRYLEWLNRQGRLTEFTMENTAPFIMSIWLHDIGKLLIPPEIMDKPTRLGECMKDVSHRIEITKLMLKMKMMSCPDEKEQLQARLEEISEANDLIKECNTIGFLDDKRRERLKKISELKCITAEGEEIPIFTEYELESITVVKGTLTKNERKVVESHVNFTRDLLAKMEFRGDYRNVPMWAAGHHEMLDGSGYPDGISGADIPWETRLLTIIDIYEALTAKDRPYKPPVSSEKAFAILREMSDNGKLDRDILASFCESDAWRD
ncbi:MAG TPA: HD domain-containing phosphohydrolase [Ruminococcus flavefaciens]|nr:HD domain-containing phosphohydrolase [Ruminococcus flavefaciens]HQM00898.1 HD domain-containing phosphohydrolase [Ruminococcus flavefaciens]